MSGRYEAVAVQANNIHVENLQLGSFQGGIGSTAELVKGRFSCLFHSKTCNPSKFVRLWELRHLSTRNKVQRTFTFSRIGQISTNFRNSNKRETLQRVSSHHANRSIWFAETLKCVTVKFVITLAEHTDVSTGDGFSGSSTWTIIGSSWMPRRRRQLPVTPESYQEH